MRFEKWEGLGNDFILVRDVSPTLDAGAIARMCDRRRGIGADGVLLVDTTGPIPRMIVHNADGTRPEMCGNGLRCVAAHLLERGTLQIATDAGHRRCEVRPGFGGADVLVDMGQALPGAELTAVFEGRQIGFATIDMGNPHAVSFDAFGERALAELGPRLMSLVPGGVNVELCVAEPERAGRFEVMVWERGVGPTLACGTGACAVAAVACDTGRAMFDAPIQVALPGGTLEVTIGRARRDVRMRGPARLVFQGDVGLS
jgi:diaminopimelate epimerase